MHINVDMNILVEDHFFGGVMDFLPESGLCMGFYGFSGEEKSFRNRTSLPAWPRIRCRVCDLSFTCRLFR